MDDGPMYTHREYNPWPGRLWLAGLFIIGVLAGMVACS